MNPYNKFSSFTNCLVFIDKNDFEVMSKRRMRVKYIFFNLNNRRTATVRHFLAMTHAMSYNKNVS